jgi:hypothetical protein
MSRNWLALVLVASIAAAQSTGCSFGEIYITDPLLREVALAEQQKNYTNLIRWSAFNRASVYVQEEHRDEFLRVAPPLKDFRFSDFDSQPVSLDESGECTVEVVYYGYRTDSPYEVEVRETQHWKRNGFTNEWQVSPVFVGLEQARRRAAAN